MYKIWRSPASPFGISTKTINTTSAESCTAKDSYTDEVLADIAANGFNGIWVHTMLHHVTTHPDFPEFGKEAEKHLAALRVLMERAAKYGIKVYLYMQPPRGIRSSETEFWQHHADVAGQVETFQEEDDQTKFYEITCFCTSTTKVRNYLTEAYAQLSAALPELGGYLFITASEYPSHCYSRRGRVIGAMGDTMEIPCTCPRCRERSGADVVVELIQAIRDGVRRSSKTHLLGFWNWSWGMYTDDTTEIVRRLPHDCALMIGFERGGKQLILGKERVIDEYALSYAGPSEEFIASFHAARENQLQILAKLQLGTTHEFGNVVNLPLLSSIYAKANFVRTEHLDGFMGCWNFGNQMSANTAGFNFFLREDCPRDEEEALNAFAAEYFPGCDTELVASAWKTFGEAMRHSYPFSLSFLYAGPCNWALKKIPYPAPLANTPGGRSWLPDPRGDRLEESMIDFSLNEIIRGFSEIVPIWEQGVNLLHQGLRFSSSPHVSQELGSAEICLAAWKSVLALYRIYQLRLHWNDTKRPEYDAIIRSERENLYRVLPYVAADPRQGYHAEAHAYMFSAQELQEKLKELDAQLAD